MNKKEETYVMFTALPQSKNINQCNGTKQFNIKNGNISFLNFKIFIFNLEKLTMINKGKHPINIIIKYLNR